MIYALIFMSLILTDRWFSIPQIAQSHQVQNMLKNDLSNKTFRCYSIAAGRRSYKTERYAKRYAVLEAIKNKDWEIHLGAPTRIQAKEILWEDLKKLVPPYLLKRKPFESELKIELENGTKIHVIGLQEFKRIHGGRSNLAIATEYQDCDPDVYNESFQPMLNDTGGLWIEEGRPFGKNHFYDNYLKGLNREPGWGSYHWKSSEILSEEQIIKAKQDLSDEDYLREYDASFETEFGVPYSSYSQLNLIEYRPTKTLPIIITCDFNATEKPMSWVLGQTHLRNNQDVTTWWKSLSYAYTNTEKMCDIVLEFLDNYFDKQTLNLNVIFYGDYSGKRKESNSTFSDWEIIENKFRNKIKSFEKRLKFCKSIRDSIAATNTQLCNALGMRRQFVTQNAKDLIMDWEKCEWAENQRELKDRDPRRGHLCRAVDYFNDYEYPSRPQVVSKQW